MRILSPAFANGAAIPDTYSCDGVGTNPPLQFVDVPPYAQSLALIMHDPDVPRTRRPDGIFNHWIMFNLDRGLQQISAGEEPAGVTGTGTSGKNGWVPMAPPIGARTSARDTLRAAISTEACAAAVAAAVSLRRDSASSTSWRAAMPRSNRRCERS
ncbi:MAG: hypothetical protein WCI74_04045, partial [Actinomycetes bacterium]